MCHTGEKSYWRTELCQYLGKKCPSQVKKTGDGWGGNTLGRKVGAERAGPGCYEAERA